MMIFEVTYYIVIYKLEANLEDGKKLFYLLTGKLFFDRFCAVAKLFKISD